MLNEIAREHGKPEVSKEYEKGNDYAGDGKSHAFATIGFLYDNDDTDDPEEDAEELRDNGYAENER